MRPLIWAAAFLLLTIVGSAVVTAGIIGLPIAGEVQAGLYVAAVLLLGCGIALLLAAPTR